MISFHNLVLITATFASAMSIISCGNDSTDSSPRLPAQRPYYDFQYNLDQLTVGIRLFHPDYSDPPKIDVYDGTTLCNSQPLSTQTAGIFTLNNNSTCRDFTLNLQYVPAANACQPGGLYLMSGTVTNPADGQTTSYNNMTLAAWDRNHNRVVPWFTPFDTPVLLSQMSQSDYVQWGQLSTVGQWTYQLDYESSVLPPDGCSLQTNLDLNISPADETLGTQVYSYTINETNVGGQITATVTPNTAGAPTASVALDGTTRHLSVVGLDVLREANIQTSMAFKPPAQIDPATTTFTPMRSYVQIDSELFLSYSNEFPTGPLASHLAKFFSTVTKPLVDFYDPLSLEPQVNVRIGVSLATPVPVQDQITYIVTPITLIPNYTFKPGFDDRTDCTALPDPGLSCRLDSIIADYNATNGAPDSAAFYTLDVTLFSRIDGQFFPAIQMPQVMIPVAETN